MRLIYLIRDGRAVCYSRVWREGYLNAATPAEHGWGNTEPTCSAADDPRGPGFSSGSLRTHLCRRSGVGLGRICEFIGTSFEPAMLDFRDDKRHGVGGNPMRFRNDEAAIRLDERWRTETCPRADRAEFNRRRRADSTSDWATQGESPSLVLVRPSDRVLAWAALISRLPYPASEPAHDPGYDVSYRAGRTFLPACVFLFDSTMPKAPPSYGGPRWRS